MVSFTDKTTFHYNGLINRHNFHYYDTENRHVLHKTDHRNLWSINIYPGIIGNRNIVIGLILTSAVTK